MSLIPKETWKKCGIKVIIDTDAKIEKHIETRMGHSNLLVVTNRYNQKYKKCRFDLVDEPKINHLEDLHVMINQKN